MNKKSIFAEKKTLYEAQVMITIYINIFSMVDNSLSHFSYIYEYDTHILLTTSPISE